MSVYCKFWVFNKLLFYNILFIISEYIWGKFTSLVQEKIAIYSGKLIFNLRFKRSCSPLNLPISKWFL